MTDLLSRLAEYHRCFQFGQFQLHKPLLLWINDGLMAIFFSVYRFRSKKELLTGSLSNIKTAIFPAIAALGRMIVPAALFLHRHRCSSGIDKRLGNSNGDRYCIALGIMALVGKNVPTPLKSLSISISNY